MRKPLSVLIAENDSEHTYRVRSVHNLHDDEVIGRILLGLAGFQVRDIKPVRVDLNPSKKNFPGYPLMPIYVVEIVTGLPMTRDEALNLIALQTGIRLDAVDIEGDGIAEKPAEPEKNYKPITGNQEGEATPDKFEPEHTEIDRNGQKQVGLKRLGDFLKDLEADRDERDENTDTRDVYEGALATHLEVSSLIGKPVRRGYYSVCALDESRLNLRVIGPYQNPPLNYGLNVRLVEAMKPNRVLSEKRFDNLIEYRINLLENPWQGTMPTNPTGATNAPFEVLVKDTDTGETYPVEVHAGSTIEARNKGVEVVHKQTGIDVDRLLVMSPKEV